MSGVRNLRAMFEQKGDGLPDRGRSPAPGGFASPSPSASPRPLSKVRTAFVAVEKDGRIGLKRETSRDSVPSVSSRRLSDDTDTTTPQLISEKSDVVSDNMASTVAPFKTNLSHEAIPESPAQDTPAQHSPKQTPKSPSKPNANPDKVTDAEEPQTKMLSGNPTESSAARLGGTVLNGGISDSLNEASTTTKAKALGAAKSSTKTTAPAPVSTAKTTARAPKSPLVTKAPNAKEPTKPATSSLNHKKPTGTKTVASKPAPIDLPSSGTGFVKPKPKSPTRPVKLPSSLTSQTAASAQKLGGSNAAPAPRRSLSRASGSAQYLSVNPTHRPLSRNSVSATATTSKTLKHRASTANISRPRPSLGPPPRPASKEQPAAKKEGHVDENFLARMMRPTQSSAKKTSEKVPVSPPRKQNVPVKKPDVKDAEKSAKRVATKIQASSAQAKTTKGTVKPGAPKTQPTAKDIAPTVAQVETAEAAVQKAGLSADTTGAPINDENTAPELVIKDVDTTTAQNETLKDDSVIPETSVQGAVDPVDADIPSTEEAQVIHEPVVSTEKAGSEPAASIPAVTEDPLKVEDIEDTVRVVPEPQPTESAAGIPASEKKSEAEEAATISTDEPKADAGGVAGELLKLEETVADGGAITTGTETKGPSTADNLLDGTNEDGTGETIAKDATVTDL